MRAVRDGDTIRQVHRLFVSGTVVGLDEAQLLGRFVDHGDEAAFAALVARHGPMVLGVCRRALADANDADDAFQATFLILVRKAPAVRERALLGNWLYGVARRVAARARSEANRRRTVERLGTDAMAEVPAREADHGEGWDLLDEEIARLAEADRAAIVLCDLEGRSGEEAARLLGLKPVTLRSRLLRARRKLGRRLIRRGWSVQGGLTAALAIAPSEVLAESTIEAAIGFAARPAAVGAISVPVAALTEGVLRAMILTKWKATAACLVAFGLVATGAGVMAQDPASERRPSTDDVRLGNMERKLDRLLEAFEGRPRPESTLAPATKLAPPDPFSQAKSRVPAESYGFSPAEADAKTKAEWARAAEAWSPMLKEQRISAIESKIEGLEKRIARLEEITKNIPQPLGRGMPEGRPGGATQFDKTSPRP